MGEYLESRKTKALERETSALPDTLPLVEAKKKEEAIKTEMTELRKMRHDLNDQIRAHKETLRNGVKVGAKKTYVKPCPGENEKGERCKGFIDTTGWKCGLCEHEICKSCHESLVVDQNHVCDPNNVETAKTVMAETKPCPKCATRIQKSYGCSQMYCVSCLTPFDWNTGEVVTGVIHNPHYYELMRKMGRGQRAVGDVPCGGLVQVGAFYEHLNHIRAGGNDDNVRLLEHAVLNLHRRAAEVSEYIRVRNAELLNRPGCEDIRLNFLLGNIKSQEEFAEAVFERDRENERSREEVQILSTFEAAVNERFNNLVAEAREIWERKKPVAALTPEENELSTLTVAQLKERLRELDLGIYGRKAELVARLIDANTEKETQTEDGNVKVKRTRKKSLWKVKSKKAAPRAKKSDVKIPLKERQALLVELFEGFCAEVREIIVFCNEAFKETFEILGYDKIPQILEDAPFVTERRQVVALPPQNPPLPNVFQAPFQDPLNMRMRAWDDDDSD